MVSSPRKTADYSWLDAPFSQISGQLMSGHLPHALLLGIDNGLGGALLAKDIAAMALCQQLSTNGACGQCKSCQLFYAGNHPDFYSISADGSQIKIDQIRDLCQQLTATAQQGGRRVAVINEAERMNSAAANALLKTLEEPGEDTLLILQSQTPGRLLLTISSRCQRVKFVAPSKQQIQQWLQKYAGIDKDICWALPVAGGPLILAELWQSGNYQRLLAYRQDWQNSLVSGHLQGSLLTLKEEDIFDVLKVLYLVLRSRMLNPKQLDAFAIAKIGQLAAKVMQQCHYLQAMVSINHLALCQGFVLEYSDAVAS